MTLRLLVVAALCVGFAQVVHCSPPLPKKPVKVKMVKTDFESRGKPWKYMVGDAATTSDYKIIKNDVTISFRPGIDDLIICPHVTVNCKVTTLTDEYAQKDILIAIDKDGNASPKTAAEIKQLIADTAPKMVNVKVLIPEKFQPPFTLIAAPNANNKPIYNKVKTGATIPLERPQEWILESYFAVRMQVPSNKDTIYLTIDPAKGKKITRKIVMSKNYPIQEGSVIRMGTSEDIFFVE